MPFPARKRRLILGTGVLALALLVVLMMLIRLALVGLAVGILLKGFGASEISFNVVLVTPWRIVVEDIGFQLSAQPYTVRRVSLTRAHWWTPSLGTLRVEQARVPVDLDRITKRPKATVGEKGGVAPPPSSLPLGEVSIDGQLVLLTAGQPGQALTVKIEAHQAVPNIWEGKASVDAPGLGLKAEARFDQASGDLGFKVPVMALDLKTWQDFLQRVVPVPAGDLDLAGKFTGSFEGRLVGGQLIAGGTVRLREGRVVQAKPALTAEGIEADLEFTDLAKLITKTGTLRIRELRTAQLPLRDIVADFALEGTDRIAVLRASLRALGGSVSVEPYRFAPSRSELNVVLLVDGISVEQVMALTQDLPAKATGQVNGRIPLKIDASGLQFGTGWLGIKPGVNAEIQFNAKGLLTSGLSPKSPSYAVLEKVESGLLKLKISELRLDIRPLDAPPGRSAQLHIMGEPLDPAVKAPVTLDLNVNGPLEKLLNMGMDSRLSFGGKP